MKQNSDFFCSDAFKRRRRKKSAIFLKAANILSSLFAYEKSPSIIDTAILEGVLPNLLQLLFSSLDQESIKIILFGLSNITGGTHEHVFAFIIEELLVQRVLTLTRNPSYVIKTEAVYVINNAIQCADEVTLVRFITEFSQDLIDSLCSIIGESKPTDTEIIRETLVSLNKMLSLDGKNAKLTEENSVKFMIDSA